MILGGELYKVEPSQYYNGDDESAALITIRCAGITNNNEIMARLKSEEHWSIHALGVFLCFRSDIPANAFDALCDGANGVPMSKATRDAIEEAAQREADAKAKASSYFDQLSQSLRLGYERRDTIKALQSQIAQLERELAEAKGEQR